MHDHEVIGSEVAAHEESSHDCEQEVAHLATKGHLADASLKNLLEMVVLLLFFRCLYYGFQIFLGVFILYGSRVLLPRLGFSIFRHLIGLIVVLDALISKHALESKSHILLGGVAFCEQVLSGAPTRIVTLLLLVQGIVFFQHLNFGCANRTLPLQTKATHGFLHLLRADLLEGGGTVRGVLASQDAAGELLGAGLMAQGPSSTDAVHGCSQLHKEHFDVAVELTNLGDL